MVCEISPLVSYFGEVNIPPFFAANYLTTLPNDRGWRKYVVVTSSHFLYFWSKMMLALTMVVAVLK